MRHVRQTFPIGTELFALQEDSAGVRFARVSADGAHDFSFDVGLPKIGPTDAIALFGVGRRLWLSVTGINMYPRSDLYQFGDAGWTQVDPIWLPRPMSFVLVNSPGSGRFIGVYDTIWGNTLWYALPDRLPELEADLAPLVTPLGIARIRPISGGRFLVRVPPKDEEAFSASEVRLELRSASGRVERVFNLPVTGVTDFEAPSEHDQYLFGPVVTRCHDGQLSALDVPSGASLNVTYNLEDRTFPPREDYTFPRAAYVGDDGALWFAAARALLGFDGERWMTIPLLERGAKEESSVAIVRATAHTIWFRFRGDLMRVDR